MSKTLVKTLILGFVLLIAASCDQGDDNGAAGHASPVPTLTSVTTATVTETTTLDPPPEVPDVTGASLAAARKRLRRASLGASILEEYTDDVPSGHVTRQSPASGVAVEQGSVVQLVIARPLPKVPDVVGKPLGEARRALTNAGFRVGRIRKTVSSQPAFTVVSQSPSAGTSVQPERRVNLVVAKAAPPSSGSGGGSNCTPGYSPCLPPASDYDCSGGSGDGPAYTGPVRVTGSDPYGLDADNDGYGCE